MPLHVLLCDATGEVARLQYQLLRDGAGEFVDAATDAFIAVDMATRLRPDVVVCELSMDGFSGADLIGQFRSASPGSRVLVWTNEREPARMAEALQAGASGYLLKDDGAVEAAQAIRTQANGVVLSTTAAALMAEETLRLDGELRTLRGEAERLRHDVSQGTSAKADFLANISHELRTPVTVAKGISYVLRNPSVSEEERGEFLTQLQSSLDKLMGIVDEIITMAELERGTFELNLEDVDLAPLVRRAVDEVAVRYEDVPIDAQVAGRLMARADATRIGHVIGELLDNACRYSPSGAGVEVRARLMDEGVVVTVTDRGEGLHRAVATQSFEEPFSTGEGVLRKEKAGVGVGLHLARQLIVEHGGTLWTDPLPGGGTRASFCIPVAAAELHRSSGAA